jgi:hypothetical protein
MKLEINVEQAKALHELLLVSMREMSHEIAATDNAAYRAELVHMRDRLGEVTGMLDRELVPAPPQVEGDAILRELSHPGD